MLKGTLRRSLTRLLVAASTIAGCSHQSKNEVASARISLTPILVTTIGGADEREGYAIGRLATAALVNNRIVVADAIARELRVYDFHGTLLTKFGRRGGGPGEHQSIRGAWPMGDSAVAVWDPQLQRLTIWSLSGTANVIPVDLSEARSLVVSLAGVLASGEYVFLDRHLDMYALRNAPDGWTRDTLRYLFLSPSGKLLARYLTLGEPKWLYHEGTLWGTDRPILGGTIDQATAGDTLLIGNSVDWSLAVVDSKGHEDRRVRGQHADVTPPPELIDLERQRMLDETAERYATPRLFRNGKPVDLKPTAIDAVKKLPAADRVPAWSRLFSAPSGGLWSCIQPPLTRRPVCDRWNLELVHLDRLDLPPDVTVHAFGRDVVLLSGTDELDRAVVRLYRLERRKQ